MNCNYGHKMVNAKLKDQLSSEEFYCPVCRGEEPSPHTRGISDIGYLMAQDEAMYRARNRL